MILLFTGCRAMARLMASDPVRVQGPRSPEPVPQRPGRVRDHAPGWARPD